MLPGPPLRTGDPEADIDAIFDWIWKARTIDEGVDEGTLNANAVEEVGDANTTGGVPILFRRTITAAGDSDVAMDHDIRVVLAWFVKTNGDGTAGNTIQLQNGTTAITNAIGLGGPDQSVGIWDLIDDAQHRVPGGTNLRVASVDGGAGGDFNCEVYVLAIRVA